MALMGFAQTYQDVDQTTPTTGWVQASGFGDPSVSATSVAATDRVLDNVCHQVDTTATASGDNTEEHDDNTAGGNPTGSQFASFALGSGTLTMSWADVTNSNWSTQAGRLQLAAGGGDSGGSLGRGIGRGINHGLSH